MATDIYHKSVLVKEVLEYLDPQPNKLYVDVTFGGGGHTRAILEKETKCKVIAIDWDKNALEKNGALLQEEFPGRLTLIWGNFAQLIKLLKKENITSVDGILADFGTSQYQITNLPGFSVYKEAFLDMRMSNSHHQTTAADVINRASQKQLEEIFFNLGEERNSKKIASFIVENRRYKKIETVGQLIDIIERAFPSDYKKKSKIHPATRVFQALRIYVNDELENINSFLVATLSVLNSGGRLVCISFHSLEDRLVKQFLKNHKSSFEILTKKVVTASPEEIQINLSSRSAKLRAARLYSKN